MSTAERIGLLIEHVANKHLRVLAIALHRWTHGRFIRLFTDRDVMLLTTRGRRSGRARTVLLQFFRKSGAGEDMIVVAANAGRSRHPDWYYNLKATPQARVTVGARRFWVRAEELSSEEAEAVWPHILEVAPSYARYQRSTTRALPLVRLTPIADSA